MMYPEHESFQPFVNSFSMVKNPDFDNSTFKIYINKCSIIPNPELVEVLSFVMFKENKRIILQLIYTIDYPVPKILWQRIKISDSTQ